MPEDPPVLPRPACPHCGEPWLRPTNLAGRYRCVNCLHRYELRSFTEPGFGGERLHVWILSAA